MASWERKNLSRARLAASQTLKLAGPFSLS